MKRVMLRRALSKLGLCSRSQADPLIRSGRVTVNALRERDPLRWVELGSDRILVAAASVGPLKAPAQRTVFILNKPRGYVTTRSDELGRRTVYDLLPPELRRGWLFPVGRLDRDSEGLLLFTDDGVLADRLTDPASHVAKTYRVSLDRPISPADMERFAAGVEVLGRRSLPAVIEAEPGDWYEVTLVEGRNRQIRRMFKALGYRVRRLVRTAVGPLGAGGLAPGQFRLLTPEEAAKLESSCDRGGKTPGNARP